jgi:hypothetical protein
MQVHSILRRQTKDTVMTNKYRTYENNLDAHMNHQNNRPKNPNTTVDR